MVTIFLTTDTHHTCCLMMCVMISVKELKRACIFKMHEVAGKFLTSGSKSVFDFFFLNTEMQTSYMTNASVYACAHPV